MPSESSMKKAENIVIAWAYRFYPNPPEKSFHERLDMQSLIKDIAMALEEKTEVNEEEIEQEANKIFNLSFINTQDVFSADKVKNAWIDGARWALNKQLKWPSENELSERRQMNNDPNSAEWARGFYDCYKWLKEKMMGG